MITLGIETSCDETALALIETRRNGNKMGDDDKGGDANSAHGAFECRVISSLVHSQAELHSAYGGVFPTLAKREHGKNLVPLLRKLLDSYPTERQLSAGELDSTLTPFKKELSGPNPDLVESLGVAAASFLSKVPAIDNIAVTEGPGLEPALWVGINFARILGAIWNKPIVPVDHMEGHIVGSLLDTEAPYGTWQKLADIPLPAVGLLVSGGHTELVKISSIGKYEIIGKTKDDAVGEAFDKAARLLGLPYPGGPHISRLSAEASELGLESPVKLPRPMIHSGDLDFSFSGLKTAVLYAVRNNAKPDGSLDDTFKKALAHEFESAAVETLAMKLRSAIDTIDAKTIVVGGGVSANAMLRKELEKIAKEYGLPLYLPSRHVSGDNALMIALAGALDNREYHGHIKAQGTKSL